MSAAASLDGQGGRVIARCREIAAFTEVPAEITRTFLSPPMHGVHALLRQWMESAGMSVSVDAIGNMRGLYRGPAVESPRLLIGSHIDTVPNAGAFDGVLGVVLGIALVEQIHSRQTKLPFAIEVVGFSEEEGVSFGKPFLGSLGLVGKLDAELLALKNAAGNTVAEAITKFGLDPKDLLHALLSPQAFAYVEFHIEQGPILESESIPLGTVSAVAGQSRLTFTFTGQANHAGTTPMQLRRDAMAAAAEWIGSVENYATNQSDLVATVGKVETWPGAGNVVAGRVVTTLDVRHADDSVRQRAVAHLVERAQHTAAKRGVEVSAHTHLEQPAVQMDSRLTKLLHTAAKQAGHPARIMTSGAGHDAVILAPHVPSAMLFLRTPGGISHHPDESVLPEDVEAALATGLEFLALLASEHAILKDTHA
jgi:allantoate deiminase